MEVAMSENEKLRGREEKTPMKEGDLPTHLREIEAISTRLGSFHQKLPEAPPNLSKSRRQVDTSYDFKSGVGKRRGVILADT